MAGDTAALVVALSAQLTKFEKDMQKAGVIADKTVASIENRFSRANPQFGGSFLGNFLSNFATKGIEKAVDIVQDLTRRFRELESVAKLVNVSMNDLFGVQQAAANFSAPIDDTTRSVRALAALLDQMQRGEENSLSKLFDANPAALRGVNREALTLQQTFKIVADLVQNAQTEIQKIDIAKAAGQAETLVKFLEQGGTETDRLAKAAAAAAPDLQKIAESAKQFDDFMAKAAASLKAWATQETIAFFENTKRELQQLIELSIKFLSLFKGESITENAAGKAIDTLRGLQKDLATTAAVAAAPVRVNITGGTTTRDPNRPLTNVPKTTTGGAGAEADRFERSTDSLQKRLAGLQAEANAIDLGTAARERARVAAELETVAKQVNAAAGLGANVVTAAQRVEIDALAASFGKVAEQIERANSPLATFARESKNIEKQLNQFGASSLDGLTDALADVVTGTKTAAEAFRALANQIIADLARIAIRQAITGPIASGLMGAFGGGAGFGSSFGGARASGGPVEAGKAYIVGENRPELFVPRQSGVILPKIPSAQNGGSTFSPVYQINAAGADSGTVARIQSVLSQHAKAIQGQTKAIVGAQRMQTTGVG